MKPRFAIENTGIGPTPWCLFDVTDGGHHRVRVLAHVRDKCGEESMTQGNICGETHQACVAEVLSLLGMYVDLARKDRLRLTDAQRGAVRLPATPDDLDISEGNGYECAIRDVQKALDAAGVQWEMESP